MLTYVLHHSAHELSPVAFSVGFLYRVRKSLRGKASEDSKKRKDPQWITLLLDIKIYEWIFPLQILTVSWTCQWIVKHLYTFCRNIKNTTNIFVLIHKFIKSYYLPYHPSVTVVINHSVVKVKHHQSLHFSAEIKHWVRYRKLYKKWRRYDYYYYSIVVLRTFSRSWH